MDTFLGVGGASTRTVSSSRDQGKKGFQGKETVGCVPLGRHSQTGPCKSGRAERSNRAELSRHNATLTILEQRASLLTCISPVFYRPACNANVQIHAIGGYSIADTWWHVPLTILWLVGCSNAFNLIDGLDGLATGVGLFATATAFLSAILTGNVGLAFVTAPLLGALLGFLPYNFSPASIFMGDCGSLTVGFLLGCFGVIWSQKSVTMLGMTAPLIAMAIPLLDTVLAIARRYLRGQAIFAADRGHIHHRLLARGFTPRRIAYLLYASAGLFAGLSLLMSNAHFSGGAVVAFCAVIWLAVRYLGYEEFDMARRMVFGGFFRRILSANLTVTKFEHAIQSARTVDDCWRALLATCRTFGISTATLHLHTVELTATLSDTVPADCWTLNVPLNGAGHVDLSFPFHINQAPATIAPLATSLRTVLAPKLLQLQSRPPLKPQEVAFSD